MKNSRFYDGILDCRDESAKQARLLESDFLACSMGNATVRYCRKRISYDRAVLKQILSTMPVTKKEKQILCMYFVQQLPEAYLPIPENVSDMYFPDLVKKAAEFTYAYWQKAQESCR